MRKIIKVCLTIAVAFLLIGLAVVTISLAFGGQSLIDDLIQGKGNIVIGNMKNPEFYLDLDEWESDEGTIYQGKQAETWIADADTIKALNIDIGAAKLYLKTSTDDAYWLETDTDGQVKCYVENGVIILRGVKNDSIGDNSKIVLSIPGNADLEKISIDIGAGKADCDSLIAKDIKIDVGAGKIECDKLVAKTLNTDIGAGKLTFNNCEVDEGTFSVSMGQLDFAGSIKKDASAECAMGSMTFNLSEREDHYNYSVEWAAGSVAIGNREYAHLASDMTIDKQAENDFQIDCAMGNVELNFNE